MKKRTSKLGGSVALIVAVIIMINPVIFGFSLGSALTCIVIGLVLGGGVLIIAG